MSRRRVLRVLGGLVAAGALVVVAGGVWAFSHLGGSPGGPVDVTIVEGMSSGAIADLLAKDGVVSDGWLFHLYLRFEGAELQSGRFTMHRHEGYRAALRELRAGPRVQLNKLVVPEGFTLAQIADRVGQLPGRSAARFLAVARAGTVRSQFEPAGSNDLEGLVFPDTYLVRPDEDEQAILQQMVDEFDATAMQLGLNAPALPNGLSPYQTVIVASLIEREAKIPDDRGMVARVVLNRLHRGMRLQIDATVLYALGIQTTHITQSDLQVSSPYNTYRVAGLPPGPIASPGKASLLAALSPTPGTWLYYVLIDPSGKLAFATTSKEFATLEAQARAKGLLG